MAGMPLTPRGWTSQPQGAVRIDPSNPLTRGLQFLYSGNRNKDIVSGADGASVGTFGPTQYFDRNASAGFTGSGSQSFSRTTAMEPSDATGMTWFVYALRRGAVGGNCRPFGKTYSNGASAPYASFDLEFNPGSAGQDVFTAVTPNGGATYSTPNSTVNTSAPFLVVVMRKAGVINVYANGVLLQSASIAAGVAYDTSGTGNLIVSGSSSAAASNAWVGDIYLAGVLARDYSAAEVQALSANPWQLFAPSTRRIYTSAVTSAAFMARMLRPVMQSIGGMY